MANLIDLGAKVLGAFKMTLASTQTILERSPPKLTTMVGKAAGQKPSQGAVKFDPKKHLVRDLPARILTMEDIGYAADTGISSVAVSDPFQLFTAEAIQIMRDEIFQPEVQATCKFSSNIADEQLRGYAEEYAPFTYEAWNHPDTCDIISRIAQVELVPVFSYEIGHINFSVKTAEECSGSLQGKAGKPIVGWHTDSYPFVCVLMMSDCTDMVGGETAIRTADGNIIKVRGPTQGCAVIMQGRYISHQAMRALGAQERITSVTSFRSKSPFLKDDSVLRTVRPVSKLPELYEGFASYRLDMLMARVQQGHEDFTKCREAGEKFDTVRHKEFLEDIIAFAAQTNNELFEESKVEKGII